MNFIVNETSQKLRGGYYTPARLAAYIASWALGKGGVSALEPSCGDGVFIDALAHASGGRELKFHAFELEADEAAKAKKKAKQYKSLNSSVEPSDFLPWAIHNMMANTRCFDSAVGNPPFVRYQYLDKDAQRNAEAIFKILGLPFTKHTNAWVPFVLASVALLKPGGRIGMILPAEIIHVRHAQSLRSYLGNMCSRILIIDPEEIWFENTLQGAVILLAEKKSPESSHSYGVGIHQVVGDNFLSQSSEKLFASAKRINGQTVAGKWTRALLSPDELSLLSRVSNLPDVHEFRDIANVDVGIVTGANDFFLVDDKTVKNFHLEEFAHPMFGRSGHCPGVIYDAQQHDTNAVLGYPTNFLWFGEEGTRLAKKTQEYISEGERQELHTRFKCRTRRPWYRVPSVYSTEVGLLKRSHDMPRLILNRIRALTTDTAYRVTTNGIAAGKLVSCFINPLTALSCELEGRHYGGGVLELVPSEIEELLIPVPEKLPASIKSLDKLIREKDATEVLEVYGSKVLTALGLKESESFDLISSWKKLKNRRQRITEGEVSLSQ